MPAECSRLSLQVLLNNVTIVLKNPKYHENIGAAARVAHNMGITDLQVVLDKPPDIGKIRKMATHNAADIIERMKVHATLEKALAPFSMVIGTTARLGRQRRSIRTPREMTEHLLPLLQKNRAALLFGPEDRGLKNEDLQYCQLTVNIPTAAFSSLNLAQAVAILCYEVHTAALAAISSGPLHQAPKLAGTEEMEGMYRHLEKVLCRIGFLQQENHQYWMISIRQFLGRMGLRAKEVRLIRGLCRQFLWYEKEHGL